MKINKVLAPRITSKTLLLLVFAYLMMTVMLMIMAAKPFEATSALDYSVVPHTVSAAAPAGTGDITFIDFPTPTVHLPAPPYIIVEPAN